MTKISLVLVVYKYHGLQCNLELIAWVRFVISRGKAFLWIFSYILVYSDTNMYYVTCNMYCMRKMKLEQASTTIATNFEVMQEEDGVTSYTEGVTIGHLIYKAVQWTWMMVWSILFTKEHSYIQNNRLREQVQPSATYQKILRYCNGHSIQLSAVLPPLPYFYLPFVFTIIQGSGRTTKNREGLGAFIMWVDMRWT